MLETVRSHGVSNAELLASVEKKDVSAWANFNSRFDYTELINLYEADSEAFRAIVLDGYSVKFVTIKGVQTLLELKFDKLEGEDYTRTETGIRDLKLDKDQLATFTDMLSSNCVVTVENEGIRVDLAS